MTPRGGKLALVQDRPITPLAPHQPRRTDSVPTELYRSAGAAGRACTREGRRTTKSARAGVDRHERQELARPHDLEAPTPRRTLIRCVSHEGGRASCGAVAKHLFQCDRSSRDAAPIGGRRLETLAAGPAGRPCSVQQCSSDNKLTATAYAQSTTRAGYLCIFLLRCAARGRRARVARRRGRRHADPCGATAQPTMRRRRRDKTRETLLTLK
jgi:hypothetical protein